MQLQAVNNPKWEKFFIDLPKQINKSNSDWICPLDNDMLNVFDKDKNPMFKNGVVERWVLLDKNKKGIGRIAVFYSPQLPIFSDLKIGGFGFFDCIDDQYAANILLKKAQNYLSDLKLDGMDGPINFGERNNWWGLMNGKKNKVAKNNKPVYGMFYHPPYYQKLLEKFGLKRYFGQFVFERKIDLELSPSCKRIAGRVLSNTTYSFSPMDLKKMDKQSEDFRLIYNEAWQGSHPHFVPLSKAEAKKNIASFKPVIDSNLILFAYHNQRPIGFIIGIPELNELIHDFDGNLNLLNKLKLKWRLVRKHSKTVLGLVFGIVPEFRGKGLEMGMITHYRTQIMNNTDYENILLNWIGDFNPKMLRFLDFFDCQKVQEYTTYRKLFDEGVAFEPHPVLD